MGDGTLPNEALIIPDWPAPASVRAMVTTRQGGCSLPPYHSMNLATHVADCAETVSKNRSLLATHLGMDQSQFCWLEQVHGTDVIPFSMRELPPKADACDTEQAGKVCAVLTADCLPILLCDMAGRRVSAVHAGWRGLLGGIVPAALARYLDASAVIAWLGPAISQPYFEVGDEVYQAFVSNNAEYESAFKRSAKPEKWYADLYLIARLQLKSLGVNGIYGGGFCTYSDPGRFYSYRRDGAASGRMASLIWLDG